VPIDSSPTEREFQNVAKLRLNMLFAGSTEGAHRACVLLGIIATCRAQGVPAASLPRLGLRAPRHDARRFQEGAGLTPARFLPAAHPGVADRSLCREADISDFGLTFKRSNFARFPRILLCRAGIRGPLKSPTRFRFGTVGLRAEQVFLRPLCVQCTSLVLALKPDGSDLWRKTMSCPIEPTPILTPEDAERLRVELAVKHPGLELRKKQAAAWLDRVLVASPPPKPQRASKEHLVGEHAEV
jgi:hypothetical protein